MIVGVTPFNLKEIIVQRYIRMILDEKWTSLFLLETALLAKIQCFSKLSGFLSVTGKQSTKLRYTDVGKKSMEHQHQNC
jgi:hypothetical protein